MKRKILLDFLIPLVILGSLTIVWRIADCDVKIQRLFYTPGDGWTYQNFWLWSFLYQ
jgi:hypothetical protein